MGRNSTVHCIVPKAGLGNQLFPIMHALVFAHLNNLPVVFTGYHQLKTGVYFRQEKVKRRYSGYFNFHKNWISEVGDKLRLKFFHRGEKVYEPALEVMGPGLSENKIFLFSALPSSKSYFEKLKPHRELAIRLFQEALRPWIDEKLKVIPNPQVGVHIRMGDFRKLAANEVYNGGHVRTPEAYYTDIIAQMLEWNPSLNFSVFTDGYRHEFEKLFNFTNVRMVEGNRDIIDLLLLSRSKVIIGTYGSTFSYWAGFISDAPFIMHRFLKQSAIRPDSMKERIFEGPFSSENKVLEDIVKGIR